MAAFLSEVTNCHKSKNAVVVFDSVFVFLDVRDNDCGYEDARTKFERKACPVALMIRLLLGYIRTTQFIVLIRLNHKRFDFDIIQIYFCKIPNYFRITFV